jgi:TolB-like protein/DNA-binding winged helix-turn-helix (wHTH) protein/tetratricopeptide (TPR) repeat protein
VSELARIKIGPWTATPALNLLERESRSIKIEPRAMDVLVFLARQNGAVASVDELIASVWKGVVVGDGSVYLAIRQLRQVLDDPDGTRYIETISKRGYRLTVAAEHVEPLPIPVAAAQPPAPPAIKRRLRWGIVATAVALIAVTAIIVLARRDAGSDVIAKSVAVLPFDNLSSDPEQEYFADGMTEEILHKLSGVRDLHVIARTSSFHFKHRNDDLRTIAAALDVEYLLEGSVRKSGEQVRISAQLVNAGSGHQLWSQTYERKLHDVFAIQDEIAKSVANALQIKLGVGEVAREPGMTRNVAAYDEYLRSLPLNLDGSYTQAIAHLQRAVALDPSFSVAWSGLNAFYTNGALTMPAVEQAEEWRRLGDEALERARALTPDAPHVLLQIAIGEARRCNWIIAAPLYEALRPAHAKYGMANQAWGPRGIFLHFVGRTREAIPLIERARAEDPLAPALAGFLAHAYLNRGDVASALAEIDRGAGLQGGAAVRLARTGFMISLNQDDRSEIERRLRAMLEVSERMARPSLVYDVAKLLDSPSAALAEIRRVAPLVRPNERAPLALLAAYFHAPELSLELLASQTSNGEMAPALWQPVMRDARKLPAFKDLVRAMGLVSYWRAYGWPDSCRPIDGEDFTCS